MPILVGTLASGGLAPLAPTIGTASDDGTGTGANVTFTAPSWTGKGSGTVTYTATSSPSSLTGTTTSGTTINVSGLTTGVSYTFTVTATTSYGVVSPASAASNSVTPASPNSYESIATATPNNAATVSFTSIPGTYTHLQLRIIGQSSTNTGVDTPCQMTFNSDTAANYSYHGLYGNGSAAYGDIAASGASFIRFYDIARVGGGADIFGGIVLDILDYADTNKYKTTRALGGYDNNSNGFISLCSGNWRSTSAINRIDISLLSGNWQNYSHIALYGIKS